MVTNRVPQDPSFNKKGWTRIENHVQRAMDKYCLDQNNKLEAFVLTGAIPSNENMANTKVNVPKTLWTAFCCFSQELDTWFACAHWGSKDSSGDELKAKTVADLTSSWGVDPFPDKSLHTTDSELRLCSSRSPSSKKTKAGQRSPKRQRKLYQS